MVSTLKTISIVIFSVRLSVCLSQSVFSVVLHYLLPFQYGFHVKEFCKLLKLLYSNKSDAPSLLSTTVIAFR